MVVPGSRNEHTVHKVLNVERRPVVGLRNAQIGVDGAEISSSRILSIDRVHVAANFLALQRPSSIRTAESVFGITFGELPRIHQLLAGGDSASNGPVDVAVGDVRPGAVGQRAVVSQLGAVLNNVSAQSVEHDDSSFLTSQVSAVIKLVAQSSGQANALGQSQRVDVPVLAFEAFSLGVIAEDDEDHLQVLNAGNVRFGSELVAADAGDDAGLNAVSDVALGPVIDTVGKGVGSRVQLVDVGRTIVKHGNDLRGLCTGDGGIRTERVIREAVQDADGTKNVDSLFVIDVGGVFVVIGRHGAGDGGEAEQHYDRQNQRKNLFEVLH